jgi:PTS system mannitol-specific IIC component
MTGVFTLTVFDAGLIAPASPGSIIAVLLMTPESSVIGVLCSVTAAMGVSFFVASILMKTQADTGEDEDALEKASEAVSSMKAASKSGGTKGGATADLATVNKIIVACDAGMGSSAMGAGLLRKKVQAANLDISVTNTAINDLPGDVNIVITHKDLTDRAITHAPNAQHMSLTNFLDSALYDGLVRDLVAARTAPAAPVETVVEDADKSDKKLKLSENNIMLGLTATTKQEAIQFAGEQLVKNNYVAPEYIAGMFSREELVSTYLGEAIAVPHGTIEAKQYVQKTGISFCQYPEGIQWGEDEDDIAKLVIGIAAQGDEHINVITAITNALDDDEAIECLKTTTDPKDVLRILGM